MFIKYLLVLIVLSLTMLCGCGSSGSDNASQTPSFSVSIQITGLSNEVTLINSGADQQVITKNGLFTFPTLLSDGEPYEILVVKQPEEQICTVKDGSGIVTGGDISDVLVTCQTIPDLEMVSVASNGVQGTGRSWGGVLNSNGRYVAFESYSSSLTDGDNNASCDVFVHDRVTDKTTVVSVASDGSPGNDHSHDPSLSDDGRYLTFGSFASNFFAEDANGAMDIFLHDRNTLQTSIVSVSNGGFLGNGRSSNPIISANGRYIAFSSEASNLVENDTNNAEDVFLYDHLTGEISRISVSSDGEEGNDSSILQSLSKEGRFIGFSSVASNLVDGDLNGCSDAFIHDRQTGETSLISVASDGTQGNNDSFPESLSADGRYVSFASYASNLVSEDINNSLDVFIHDRVTRETEKVSVSSGATQGNEESWDSDISADGRFVAFVSRADNLVIADDNNKYDIFVHDRTLSETFRVSVSRDNLEGDDDSMFPSFSSDGRFIVFSSLAGNLVDEDSDLNYDVFVRKL